MTLLVVTTQWHAMFIKAISGRYSSIHSFFFSDVNNVFTCLLGINMVRLLQQLPILSARDQ